MILAGEDRGDELLMSTTALPPAGSCALLTRPLKAARQVQHDEIQNLAPALAKPADAAKRLG